MVKKRKGWVDLLRCFSVFLVVLGHFWSGSIFYFTINQLKMPLFYVVAGLFIKVNQELKAFIKNLAFRIGVPYLIFSLVLVKLPYYLVMRKWSIALDTFIDFITGKSFWFIPSFFLAQVFFYLIYHLFKGKKISVIISSMACFIVGYIVAKMHILHFLCIDTALTSVIFICSGFILKDYLDSLESLNIPFYIVPMFIYIILCFIFSRVTPLASLNFHTVKYGNLPVNILMMLVGIPGIILLSMLLDRYFSLSIFKLIGRNTLVVYLLSSHAVSAFSKVFHLVGINVHTNFIATFITVLLTCISCAIVSELCTKYVPWMVGIKKK